MDFKMDIKFSADLTPVIKALTEFIKLKTGTDVDGVIYNEKRIKRAETDIEVSRIEKLGAIETDLLIQRATSRLEKQAIIKQQNIENIYSGALEYLSTDATPEKLNIDWLNRFVEYSERVSDVEVKTLWSKILAGEVNDPGKFSFRTLRILNDLSKEEANLVLLMSKLCLLDAKNTFHLLVPDTSEFILSDFNLSYDDLIHLDAIGIITRHDGGIDFQCNCYIDNKRKMFSFCSYDGKSHDINIIRPILGGYNRPIAGMFSLTREGQQILTLLDHDNTDLLEYYTNANVTSNWYFRN